ncbi:MAG: hypothetical protein BWZ08_00471 [candidate division BRC1 bacterium ADurb.BinA292]|nr:MAG: hypothetical protein BWZ08_00471 [candidate division BRC1 bacterium ADurb.BinA292]HOR28046.1 hypothetical protein [Candidatus Sumerlaeota bacterium]
MLTTITRPFLAALFGMGLVLPATAMPPAQDLNGSKPLVGTERIVFETGPSGEWHQVEGSSKVDTDRGYAVEREPIRSREPVVLGLPASSTISDLSEPEKERIIKENEELTTREEFRAREEGLTYDASPPSPANELYYPIDGHITRIMKVEYPGVSEEHILAEVDTAKSSQGRVELGPASKVAHLNLKEGDSIYVEGRPGRLNGQPVMIAQTVKANGEVIKIEREMRTSLHQVDGSIEGLRTVRYQGQDGDHLIARVDLKGRGMETVDLGPADQLRDLELSEGDLIGLSVYPGRINGDAALIAWKVEKGDRSVEIERKR